MRRYHACDAGERAGFRFVSIKQLATGKSDRGAFSFCNPAIATYTEVQKRTFAFHAT